MSHPKYKLVVSDMHLGKGRYFKDGTQNILEDFIYDREFAEFLQYYRSGEYADAEVELVLNGDILNLLQMDNHGVHTHLMTERATVRALRRIIEGHPDFFDALRRFCSFPHHRVIYVIGNHDVGMMWPEAKRVFNQAIGAEARFFDVAYVQDGIHIEHGQQYELQQKTNLKEPFILQDLPEPVLNLPLGSIYVAVLLPELKQERPHLDKVRPVKNFLRFSLISDTYWTLKTFFKISKFILETILFRRRYHIRMKPLELVRMMVGFNAYPNYDRIAVKFLRNSPQVHTLILGHTHILRYRQLREGKEYFNEGTWNEVTTLEFGEFGTQTRLTYAFIEYPPDRDLPSPGRKGKVSRPKTRLKEWRGAWKPEMDILA